MPDPNHQAEQERARKRSGPILPTSVMLAIFDAANTGTACANTLIKCWERLYDEYSKPHPHTDYDSRTQRAAEWVREAYERYQDILDERMAYGADFRRRAQRRATGKPVSIGRTPGAGIQNEE